MNDDLIRRSDAINVIKRNHHRLQGDGLTYTVLIEQMKLVPKEKDLLYICDRERCDNCHSECELTSDINHAAGAGAVIIFDKAAMPKQGEWIPCRERLPKWDERVLLYLEKECYYDYPEPHYEMGWWVQEGCFNDKHGVFVYDSPDIGKTIPKDEVIAWMPLPEPWKGTDDE